MMTSIDGASPGGAFRALRHRPFLIFWIAAGVSNTGAWFSMISAPFALLMITDNAMWVGLVQVASLAPLILIAPLGGVIADRFDRRKVLLVTQAAHLAAAVLLWSVWIAGVRDPLAILGPLALAGLVQGFNAPAWQSFVNDLVPKKDLRSAVTLNSMQFNAARSVGPAVAGALLAATASDPAPAFLANAISFLVVLVALYFVRAHSPQKLSVTRARALRQIRQADVYIRTQPGLITAILVCIMTGLFVNPIFSLAVILADRLYGVGAVQLGFLTSALGIGAVLAAPIVAGRLRLSVLVRGGGFIFAAGLVFLALVPVYELALPVLVVMGACFLCINSSNLSALQLIVADQMRGRVMSLRIVIFQTSTMTGAFWQATAAQYLGIKTTLLIAGACLLVMITLLSLFKQRFGLVRLNDPHDVNGGEPEPTNPGGAA